MDRINFYSGDKFPQYRQALAKMQDMTNLVASLAGLGGKNYILSGCEKTDIGEITDGIIVIKGEVIPFKGSEKKDRITIVENRIDVPAFGVNYPELYIERVAEFSETGEYFWSDFEPAKTNQELAKSIKDIVGDPVGTVKSYAGFASKIPADYLLCDGRELSKNEYPVLFDNIGTQFGGDGVNSFRLPDLRGCFIAGYSGGGDYAKIGQKGGAETVSLSAPQNGKHKHGFKGVRIDSNNWRGTGDPTGSYTVYDQDRETEESGNGEAHENRPPFVVLAQIIKIR